MEDTEREISFGSAAGVCVNVGVTSSERGVGAGPDIGVTGGDSAGAATGEGADAVSVRVGVTAAGAADVEGRGGGEDAGPDEEIAPSSRLTSFGGAVFPEKNSPAVSAGSIDGAGG